MSWLYQHISNLPALISILTAEWKWCYFNAHLYQMIKFYEWKCNYLLNNIAFCIQTFEMNSFKNEQLKIVSFLVFKFKKIKITISANHNTPWIFLPFILLHLQSIFFFFSNFFNPFMHKLLFFFFFLHSKIKNQIIIFLW